MNMKKNNILVTVSSILLLLVGVSCKDGINKKIATVFEKKFESKEGSFKIAFVNPPKITSENIPYQSNNITIPVHMFMDEETPLKAGVIYADYPKGILKGIDVNAQKVLAGAKDGALNSLAADMGKYVIESEKNITVNGASGIIFSASFEKGLYVIYELVLKDDRLYQIRMFNEKNYPDKEISDKFFNSFEITN